MYKPFQCMLLIFMLFCTSAFAGRQVTDQLNRTVTLPDRITRAVVLQHQTLNLLVQLDAMPQVVGVLSSWQKQLGPNYLRLAPSLANMPTPGDLTAVNIESLLALHPQVVFVANYAPAEMIAQIERAGIPVVAISLRHEPADQAGKINPVLQDEDRAYNLGLQDGIRLIGNVMGRQAQAEAMVKDIFAQRAQVANRLRDLPAESRVRVYMANPDLTTYGSGKYTGLMMQHAGAVNVAAKDIQGFKQVSIEDVLKWNPAVIFVQERYPDVVQQILNSPQWQTIDAVKHQRVYLMPEYAKAWGYPMPEALALGELWMAKMLYPQRFADIDLQQRVDAYYKRYYRASCCQSEQ
ncbi:iron complex transport system substrate-binding protein [Serratia fonticola]|uniref:Iron complex transport system substrate-binding protein n=1 Tax=Serratia fonticola TaxID=47917 RepID=A0A542D5M3_SERFO|nr:ABC transporter substrate-binding protein [Serratia fonticola]TQI79592.1 iron complex transport system substrate-binding protein [Serratia fonticola]TQI98382.1 iron complex transport system substrate-binding protein [Serratia fonticola]TVZ67911.1 iron complex transport system substrate-binding protein [Serratia fonticola]